MKRDIKSKPAEPDAPPKTDAPPQPPEPVKCQARDIGHYACMQAGCPVCLDLFSR